jgi:benzoate membrane transport protein
MESSRIEMYTWKQNLYEFPKLLSIGGISSGFVSWLFGATGPLLIVLQAASKGHLGAETISSWIFAIYFIGGLLSLFFALYYRQPIGFAFSIPGAILVGNSLGHHSFSQAIGAYLVTGIVIAILGMSGIVTRLMKVLPMPIMMGMVSGVLLPFGTSMFSSVTSSPIVNGIPLAVFLVLSCFGNFAKKFPPILGAIIASVILLKFNHAIHLDGVSFGIATPKFFAPSFDVSTMGELVLPLVLTVVAIQNAQGIAVLNSTGYKAPIGSMTTWSGIGSIVNGFFGAHAACIAGPMTAILSGKDAGAKPARYVSAIVLGVLSCLFGLFAPMAAAIPHMIPTSVISLLGGLAMINVLTDSLHMSFSSKFKIGALFSFMITVSGISIMHIGAPFWGLVGGMIASLLMERKDFSLKKEN